MSLAISIMAKAPVAGEVKTRLCPPLSHDQAAELATAFLVDTWHATRDVAGAEVLLVYAGDRTQFPRFLQTLPAFLQRGADLGARIEHAARVGLSRADRVVVIGTDLPGLPTAHLIEARDALDTYEAVLGPSGDGGFYLIGLHACPPGLLAGLPWSVPETSAACTARLAQRGLHVGTVSSFDDVDDIDDLRRLRRQLDNGLLSAPATANVLSRLSCA